MARRRIKVRRQSVNLDNKTMWILIVGVVAGFAGGFFFAKERYMGRIVEISRMNMEKAVTIDSLREQVQVLGASTKAE